MHIYTDAHIYRCVYYAQINIYTHMRTETYLHTDTHIQIHILCTDKHIHRDAHTYKNIHCTQINTHTDMHPHTDTHRDTYTTHKQTDTHRYTHKHHTQIHTQMRVLCTDKHTQIHAHTPHVLPSPVPLSWGPAVPLQAEALIQGGCGAQAQVWGFRDALPAPKGSQVKGPWPLDWRPQFWLWGWGHSGQFFPLWPPVGPSD